VSPEPSPFPVAEPAHEEGSLDFGSPVFTRVAERAKARKLLAGPAIGLMVAGILGLIGPALIASNAFGGGGSGAYVIGSMIGIVVTSTWSIIVLVGASKMRSGDGYGRIMTCCIVAMLPCNLMWILALPMAIWGLVVMKKPEVQKAIR
jgi:hypothetical protein